VSENGERALLHEALRDLRQEIRSVSSEVAELRVEVSALGVGALNERLTRVESRQDEMRDSFTCMMQSQRSLRRQVERWLPYALLAAFGGAELSGSVFSESPLPVADAATE
tara:strand:+ start:551 stop:883 length:333 start_codon:yes stop_codon:yes gene_type:complete